MGGEIGIVITMMENILNRIVGWLDQSDQDTCARVQKRIDKRCWMVANAKRAYSLMLAAIGGVVPVGIVGIAAAWTFGAGEWFVALMVLCMLIAGGADVWLWWRYKREGI